MIFKPVPDREVLKWIVESDNYRRKESSFTDPCLESFKGQETLNKFLGKFGDAFNDLDEVNVEITLPAGDRKNSFLYYQSL